MPDSMLSTQSANRRGGSQIRPYLRYMLPAAVLLLTLLTACTADDQGPTSLAEATSTRLPTHTPDPTDTPNPPTATATFTPEPTATFTATPLPAQLTDGSGADMVLIPAGEFTMGSEVGFVDEEPVHQVYVDAFYIDRLETTNAEYQRCVEEGACAPPIDNYVDCNTPQPARWLIRHPNYYLNPEYADYPVICLDWYDARNYCQWRGARLPTEAEWEKAARGTDARTYPWGDEPPNPELLSFLWGEGEFDRRPDYMPSAVGSYPAGASPYGVLDMAGNVYEWVEDIYDKEYYAVSPYENPAGPEVDEGGWRIARGGSFWNLSFRVRAANRNNAFLPADLAHFDAGVRCASDIP